MKKLDLMQMESFQGGSFDCSTAGRLQFVAGASVAGCLFFGWGGLVAGYAAAAFTVAKCEQ